MLVIDPVRMTDCHLCDVLQVNADDRKQGGANSEPLDC